MTRRRPAAAGVEAVVRCLLAARAKGEFSVSRRKGKKKKEKREKMRKMI